MKKLTFLLVIGSLLVFSTSLVWGQTPTSPAQRTPAQFNSYLESLGQKLIDPQKCPSWFVTVQGGKNIFGTMPIAYNPGDGDMILAAYGVNIKK